MNLVIKYQTFEYSTKNIDEYLRHKKYMCTLNFIYENDNATINSTVICYFTLKDSTMPSSKRFKFASLYYNLLQARNNHNKILFSETLKSKIVKES